MHPHVGVCVRISFENHMKIDFASWFLPHEYRNDSRINSIYFIQRFPLYCPKSQRNSIWPFTFEIISFQAVVALFLM